MYQSTYRIMLIQKILSYVGIDCKGGKFVSNKQTDIHSALYIITEGTLKSCKCT